MKNDQNTKNYSEGQLWYRNVYLRSKHWMGLKAKVRIRDQHVCAGCGTNRNLHVHHIIYSKFYNENPDELLTLCERCHQLAHTLWPQTPPSFPPLQLRDALCYFLFHSTELGEASTAKMRRKREAIFAKLPQELQDDVKSKMQERMKSQPKPDKKKTRGVVARVVKQYGPVAKSVIDYLRKDLKEHKSLQIVDGVPWVFISYQEWSERLPSVKPITMNRLLNRLLAAGVLETCPKCGGKEKHKPYRLII